MILRHPRSRRTDTIFPYATLFRVVGVLGDGVGDGDRLHGSQRAAPPVERVGGGVAVAAGVEADHGGLTVVVGEASEPVEQAGPGQPPTDRLAVGVRSEESRVGKECVSTVEARWGPSNSK